MASIKRFAVLALLSIQAAALESPIPGYGVHTFEWDIEVFPDRRQNLTGTVEQVHRQVRELNPRWEPPVADASTVDRRGELPLLYWRSMHCGQGLDWGGVEVSSESPIVKGIQHLRELSKTAVGPKAGPGPGLCGRVSCSWNSAIWWCNDSPKEKQLASWLNIADGAFQILRRCSQGGDDSRTAKGQVFTDSDWNVIVRADDC